MTEDNKVFRNLYFLGNDDDFFEEVDSYFSTILDVPYKFENSVYKTGSILEMLNETVPNVVYIDLTTTENMPELFSEISFIKNNKKFRSILFVAIFGNQDDIDKNLNAYISGFQYGFVKGKYIRHFLLDSLYIGVTEPIVPAVYAKAKDINKPFKLGFSSSITDITMTNFTIESDLLTVAESLDLKLPFFDELEAETFDIEEHNALSKNYPLLESYIVKLPIPGPWEDISEETIQPETVETWLDLNNEEFQQKEFYLKVFNSNEKLTFDLFNCCNQTDIFFDNVEYINGEVLLNLSFKRPLLIFFETDTTNTNDMLNSLIEDIKKVEDYTPIVIITNCPSKTKAFQKVFQYENLIASSDKLTKAMFEGFVKLYQEKNLKNMQRVNNFFEIDDQRRYVDLVKEVQIKSLTEHEIVFEAEFEIPFYSVIKLSLPVECFITIIPFPESQIMSHGEFEYLGCIHSISEHNINDLRKFVNQIIYNPIPEFTKEVVRDILQQKETKEVPVEVVEHNSSKATSNTLKKEIDELEIQYKRPELSGKSKL